MHNAPGSTHKSIKIALSSALFCTLILITFSNYQLNFKIDNLSKESIKTETKIAYTTNTKEILAYQDESLYESVEHDNINGDIEGDSMDTIHYEQEMRKQHIEEICSNDTSIQYQISDRAWKTYHIDEKHHVVYCANAKVASTSWKELMLRMAGITGNGTKIRAHVIISDIFENFKSKSDVERDHMMSSFTSFTFVRHPLSRLVSAYMDKVYGDLSFRDFRCSVVEYLYPDQHIPEDSQCNTNITFAGFVDAIMNADDRKINTNYHWDTQYTNCNPCRFKFDYIGKQENLSKDQSYVIDHIFKEDLVLPTRNMAANNGTPGQIRRETPARDIQTYDEQKNFYEKLTHSEFYDEVPRENLDKLYQKYKYDFLLFGYNMNTDI